jgi:hypothetical protein
MALIISAKVRQKLASKSPPVTEQEIHECFWNRAGKTLIDDREPHRTKPPTRWFIAETASGRRLKIVFIRIPNGNHVLKSAYEPDHTEEFIYEKEAGF